MSLHDTLTIALCDVPVVLCVGVPEAERASPQTLLISLTLHQPEPPSFTDEPGLAATIDYAQLLAFLQHDLPRFPPAELIETVAERVLRHTFESTRVSEAEVVVKKPSVAAAPGMVSITLKRVRP